METERRGSRANPDGFSAHRGRGLPESAQRRGHGGLHLPRAASCFGETTPATLRPLACGRGGLRAVGRGIPGNAVGRVRLVFKRIGVSPEVNGRIRSRPIGRGETRERPACGARGLLEQQGQELPRGGPQQEQARESQQESGISCLSVPRHDGRPQGRWPTDGAGSRSRRSLTCGTKPGSAPGGRRNLSGRWPGNDREEVRRGTRSHLNLPLLSRL